MQLLGWSSKPQSLTEEQNKHLLELSIAASALSLLPSKRRTDNRHPACNVSEAMVVFRVRWCTWPEVR